MLHEKKSPFSRQQCIVNAADDQHWADLHSKAAARFNPMRLSPEELIAPVPNVGIPAIVFWRHQSSAAASRQAAADGWRARAETAQ